MCERKGYLQVLHTKNLKNEDRLFLDRFQMFPAAPGGCAPLCMWIGAKGWRGELFRQPPTHNVLLGFWNSSGSDRLGSHTARGNNLQSLSSFTEAVMTNFVLGTTLWVVVSFQDSHSKKKPFFRIVPLYIKSYSNIVYHSVLHGSIGILIHGLRINTVII